MKFLKKQCQNSFYFIYPSAALAKTQHSSAIAEDRKLGSITNTNEDW